MIVMVEKVAPGPPPKPHWRWHEPTRHWRNPENWEESSSTAGLSPSPSEWAGQRTVGAVIEDAGYVSSELWEGFQVPTWEFDPTLDQSHTSYRVNQGVADYVGYSGSETNQYLRGERSGLPVPDRLQHVVVGVQEAMKPLGSDQVLYRGISASLKGEPEVGKVIPLDAFTSTSRDPGVAYEMTHISDIPTIIRARRGTPVQLGTFMQIYAPEGTRGITFSGPNPMLHEGVAYDHEEETLLDMSQGLLVEHVDTLLVKHPRLPEVEMSMLYVRGRVQPNSGEGVQT